MRFMVVLALLPLAACSGFDGAKDVVLDRAKLANDRVMDDARAVTCNNVYSAETRYRTRHSIEDGTFNAFCGRDKAVVR